MDETKSPRIYRIALLSYRLLAAVFMVVIVSGALLWAWNAIQDRRLENAGSAPRVWPEQELFLVKQPAIGRLETRCRDGNLYYRLQIEPENAEKSEAAIRSWSGMKFIVNLYDEYGFAAMRVEVGNLARVIDEQGTLTKMRANEKTSCDKKAYSTAKYWGIAWK
jgi:hypothetical protein